MRIKRLGIGDFGKLHDTHIALDEKITVIYGKNEVGKSSVASFIKYMLYGFGTTRSQDLSENQKKKYMPWDAAECCGEMMFTSDGKAFTVARKTSAKNQVGVFDENNNPVNIENPGEHFLGVSENCFKKTAFIGQSSVTFSDEGELDEAIRNMVYSADETMDSQKAMKKLETLRKFYLGKAGRSGEIFEIDKELDELKAEREKWKDGHKQLLAAEYQLEDVRKKIQEKKLKKEEIEREAENLTYYGAKQKLCEIEKAKEKLASKKEVLEKGYSDIRCGDFVPDEEYLKALNEGLLLVKTDSEKLSDMKKASQKAKENYESICNDSRAREVLSELSKKEMSSSDALERIADLEGKASKFARLSLVFTLLFFLVVTIPLAIIFRVKKNNAEREISEFCKDFAFANVSELKKMLASCESMAAVENSTRRIYEDAEESVMQAKSSLDKSIENLKALAAECGINPQGEARNVVLEIKNFAEILETKLCKIEEMKRDFTESAVEYKTMCSSCDMEELKQKAEKYDDSIHVREEIKIKQEYAFYTQSIEGLELRERELEKNTAVLSGTLPKPSEIQSRILSLEEQRNDYSEKQQALDMAMEALTQASENMRSTATPRITAETGKLFAQITQNKYRALYADEKMNLSFLQSGEAQVREAGYLSTGTLDAAYISLRVALCKFLYKDSPVLVFDDAFSHMDDERLENTLAFLQTLSEDFQIIIFSCHDREKKYFEGKAKVVDFVFDEEN